MNKLQLAILIAAVVALECAIQPDEPRCDQAATAAGKPAGEE